MATDEGVRRELQSFAQNELRRELAGLRGRLRQDIADALRSHLDEAMPRERPGDGAEAGALRFTALRLSDPAVPLPPGRPQAAERARPPPPAGDAFLLPCTPDEDPPQLPGANEQTCGEAAVTKTTTMMTKTTTMDGAYARFGSSRRAFERRTPTNGRALTGARSMMRGTQTMQSVHSMHRLPSSYASLFLEYGVSVAIILNAIITGCQTDYMARNLSEDLPAFFLASEITFFLIFSTELVLKLWMHGKQHFVGPMSLWNIFDFSLVLFQLWELAMWSIAKSGGPDQRGVDVVRVLRVLRILKAVRLVRILQFISELTLIVQAISNSLKSLFWMIVLLVIMMYIVATVFTVLVCSHRIQVIEAGGSDILELSHWWGSLSRSILTLYEVILGGADWDEIVTPLNTEMSFLLGLLFTLYMAFASLAVMNVITGIFVDSALRSTERDKDRDFGAAMAEALGIGESHESLVTKHEFDACMDNPTFRSYCRSMGVITSEAKSLFRMLDDSGANAIDGKVLLGAMVRLRAGARFMDVVTMMNEIERHNNRWLEWTCRLEKLLAGDPRAKTRKPHSAAQRRAGLEGQVAQSLIEQCVEQWC